MKILFTHIDTVVSQQQIDMVFKNHISQMTGAELHTLYVIPSGYSVTARSVKGWTVEFEEILNYVKNDIGL